MSRAETLRIADYLQHILEAIDSIQDYTAGMNLDEFMADCKTRDAVIRNLEIIGEACNIVANFHESRATPRIMKVATHAPCRAGFNPPWTTEVVPTKTISVDMAVLHVKNHPAFASEHAEVPWGFAYEMRNALSHGYFTVNHAIVWQPTSAMREALLDACALDWSATSPAIFGSLFQSTMDSTARRNLGAHDTSASPTAQFQHTH